MRALRVSLTIAAVCVCALAVCATAGAAPRVAHTAPPAETVTKFPEIAILAYHDVTPDPGNDDLAVTPEELRAQLRAYRAQGWTFVPLSRLIANREHPEKLPPRTLVITFDDGYRSFTQRALPILRAAGVRPAFAPITGFVGTQRPLTPPLLDWNELRALARAGDVELVSHTHELHGNEPCSPQGVTGPSVGSRMWVAAAGAYEDREQYRDRIGEDLTRSQRAFREELGAPARVLVWPYGVHNEMARAQAAHAGFEITLALEHRLVTAADLRSGCLPRFLFHQGWDIERDPDWYREPAPPVRMATVPLDGMWKAGEPAMRRALDEAVARVRAVGANAVLIPVFAPPDRDGRLSTSFAMNHQAQIAADVWAFAADRFRQEEFRVWALVPTLNLTWAWDRDPTLRMPVRAWPGTHGRWSTKLSPDLAPSRRAAVDLVTDLAVYLQLDGMVFDDDVALVPSERLAANGSKDPIEKAAAVRGLIDECKRAVLAWRPECRFGRIVPQDVVEQPGTNAAYAMSLEDLFGHDEMAMTPLVAPGRGSSPQEVSLTTEKLARRAASRWYRLRREGEVPVVFLIPARDPRDGRAVPSEFQVAMARALHRVGLYHRGSLAPMAAGELPLGLLDAYDPVPVQQASRRR